jgi:hypothetical protein
MTAQLRFGLLGPLEARGPAGLVQLRTALQVIERRIGQLDEAEAAHERFKVIFPEVELKDDLLEQFLTDS